MGRHIFVAGIERFADARRRLVCPVRVSGLALGAAIGYRVDKRLDHDRFRKVVLGLLAVLGAVLEVRAWPERMALPGLRFEGETIYETPCPLNRCPNPIRAAR